MNAALHELQHAKAVWLSHGFMFGRLVIGLGVLTLVGWRLIRADLVPDMLAVRGAVPAARRRALLRSMDPRATTAAPRRQFAQQERIRRLAPIYVVLYAIVLTLVAFDGIMALQPHWFSNLLGGFFFMGSFLGAHMLLALMMIYGASHLGVTDLVSPKQRHDLGKLCFGFTVFWTYLMWAQFLVIWYGNLPEETGFVFARLWGHWLPVGKAVLIGMFIIPFFGLLGVAPKKVRATLGFFAVVSLTALWLERYLLVMPSVTRAARAGRSACPRRGRRCSSSGLYLLSYALFARTFPMISPRLAEITLERERGHASALVAAEFDHEESPKDYVSPESIERRGKPRRVARRQTRTTDAPRRRRRGASRVRVAMRYFAAHLRVQPADHRPQAVGGQVAGDGEHPVADLHGHRVVGVGPTPRRSRPARTSGVHLGHGAAGEQLRDVGGRPLDGADHLARRELLGHHHHRPRVPLAVLDLHLDHRQAVDVRHPLAGLGLGAIPRHGPPHAAELDAAVGRAARAGSARAPASD